MNRKLIIAVLAVIVVTVIVGKVNPGRKSAPGITSVPETNSATARVQPLSSSAQLPVIGETSTRQKIESKVKSALSPTVAKAEAQSQTSAPTSPRVRPAKEPIKDPMARQALALVGVDPEAEAYWFDAINDPDLSEHERKDLIEDLNEDGLSDPKHPTPDDLPIIMSRIELINEIHDEVLRIGPEAMPPGNYAAFDEALKDLINLANLVNGRGKPVN